METIDYSKYLKTPSMLELNTIDYDPILSMFLIILLAVVFVGLFVTFIIPYMIPDMKIDNDDFIVYSSNGLIHIKFKHKDHYITMVVDNYSDVEQLIKLKDIYKKDPFKYKQFMDKVSKYAVEWEVRNCLKQ